MTRSSGAPLPPSPPDLPQTLGDAAEPGELRGLELRESAVKGLDWSGRSAADLRIVESRLERVDLSNVAAPGLSLRDVVVHEGSWAGLGAESAVIHRVELRGARLTGAVLSDASL